MRCQNLNRRPLPRRIDALPRELIVSGPAFWLIDTPLFERFMVAFLPTFLRLLNTSPIVVSLSVVMWSYYSNTRSNGGQYDCR